MKRITIIALLVVSVLGLIGVYAYLGGFNRVRMELVQCKDFVLVGREFIGTPQDEALGLAFRDVESSFAKSPLYTIYYSEPAGKRDTLHVFVGKEVRKELLNVPEGWVKKPVGCHQAIRASMDMHQLVMPAAENVKQMIAEFAQKEQVNPKGIYIDKIISRNKVEVWVPVAD
ncbi:hypothetical protein SAMN04488057_105327 [Cyclobacterium lianum]|uniref:GyrI-like small molecule binding domain-containing protein n=1 Tax=Cyclobacterium lianum TaxID=388280 RepID=A0A1M7NHD8_9BACT|nr:hypothetical protein [Cyclobacterium lianum]SHN03145.1 hypothetical protein SAMN04488057_105327 [Cyclobacterium lianum]